MTLTPTFLSKPESAVNRTFLMLTLVALTACAKAETKVATIPTATIQRRDIVVNAEATGIIEPINVIEVKSKTASGQVTKMSIEIGTFVKPGDLIVQIDTTDLHTQFEQSKADYAAASSNFEVAKAQLTRQQQLFKERIITQSELETAQTAFANAQATQLRNQGTRDLNAQRLTDATVRASITGTIITKPVSLGQVIQAGGGSVSGGSVIATMADLTKVRARALVNETDIGAVAAGQPATVTVDAFPDRVFRGIVEKIEPSATVQQNVTMFPVLISLDNSEGLLRPGMNGEVAVLTDERLGVIAVPNDAIRSPREAAVAAGLLGLNPDSVRAKLRGPGGGNGGGRGGSGGGRGGSGGGMGGGGMGGGGRGDAQVSKGELDLLAIQGGGQDRQGGGQGSYGGRGQQVEVTDADCKAIDAAMKKKPAVAKKLDDLRTKMSDPSADRTALRDQMTGLYKDLGVDMMKSGACRRKAGGDGGGGMGGGMSGGQGGGGRGGRSGGGAVPGAGAMASGRQRQRTGLVFIQKGATWEPKSVRLGVANYDYTEVIDGLAEGDKVAMLSVAALQAKRQEQNDRMKSMTGSPLGGGAAGSSGGRGGPGGGRGN
ncbi:MAG: efflux RND transporter periplasmic adaptor subunit [Gemmatimonadetes bacterium]|nr:efflux RND transporter periplasmic adaptor subunit [Gemmatimonadota bacterium]